MASNADMIPSAVEDTSDNASGNVHVDMADEMTSRLDNLEFLDAEEQLTTMCTSSKELSNFPTLSDSAQDDKKQSEVHPTLESNISSSHTTESENETDQLNASDKNCDSVMAENSKGDNCELCDRVDVGNDDDEEEEYHSAEEGDDVDEDYLKELEETLTDDEKKMRRDQAQELKEEGNKLFKDSQYSQARKAYGKALQLCPLSFQKDRSIMYSNKAACHMRLEEFEKAIEDSSKALELNPNYMKALQRRAELYQKSDKLDEALADYTKLVEMDPSNHGARAACMRLPDQIKERNEKMKEEMLGKLKDLGNMILKPFGLSTNNFQLQQDPNTGGYSVNFNNNGS